MAWYDEFTGEPDEEAKEMLGRVRQELRVSEVCALDEESIGLLCYHLGDLACESHNFRLTLAMFERGLELMEAEMLDGATHVGTVRAHLEHMEFHCHGALQEMAKLKPALSEFCRDRYIYDFEDDDDEEDEPEII